LADLFADWFADWLADWLADWFADWLAVGPNFKYRPRDRQIGWWFLRLSLVLSEKCKGKVRNPLFGHSCSMLFSGAVTRYYHMQLSLEVSDKTH
jgi:hypothetical protein